MTLVLMNVKDEKYKEKVNEFKYTYSYLKIKKVKHIDDKITIELKGFLPRFILDFILDDFKTNNWYIVD